MTNRQKSNENETKLLGDLPVACVQLQRTKRSYTIYCDHPLIGNETISSGTCPGRQVVFEWIKNCKVGVVTAQKTNILSPADRSPIRNVRRSVPLGPITNLKLSLLTTSSLLLLIMLMGRASIYGRSAVLRVPCHRLLHRSEKVGRHRHDPTHHPNYAVRDE